MGAVPPAVAEPTILAACLLAVVLSVWMPVLVVRRWVPAPWRAFTASVLAALVLALAFWLAVLSLRSLAAG